jgi:hypothetical protein
MQLVEIVEKHQRKRKLLNDLILTDTTLRPIADKVLAGRRLAFEDGIELYRSPDLLAVGFGQAAPYQSEQRLRGALQAVRVWPRP